MRTCARNHGNDGRREKGLPLALDAKLLLIRLGMRGGKNFRNDILCSPLPFAFENDKAEGGELAMVWNTRSNCEKRVQFRGCRPRSSERRNRR